MSGRETIERFNAELDAALAGVGVISASDPGALELSVRLAGADFSARPEVRGPLRARLLARRAAMEAEEAAVKYAPGPLRAFRPALRFALAAACLLLLLVPALRRPAAPPQPGPAPAAPKTALPPAVAPAAGTPESAREEAGEQAPPEPGIFRGLPMAGIPRGGRAEPPVALISGFPLRSVKGTRAEAPAGVTVTWETDYGTIVLEQRAVTPADLFEKRTL